MKGAYGFFFATAVGVVLLLVAVCVAEFARRDGGGSDEVNAATVGQQAAGNLRGASGQADGEASCKGRESSARVRPGAAQVAVSPQERFDQLVGDVLAHAVDELDATIKARHAVDDKEAQACELRRQRACRSREEEYVVFSNNKERER